MTDDLYDELSDAITDQPAASFDDNSTFECPVTIDDADWHARRLAKYNEDEGNIIGTANVMRARIEEWMDREIAKIAKRAARHEQALRAYHQWRLDQDPHAKTIELPTGGRLRSVAGKVKVVVDDPAALVEWAEAQGLVDALVNFPAPKPDLTAIAKRYGSKAAGEAEPGDYPAVDPATGDICPHAIMRRGERAWYIDPPAPASDDLPTKETDK